MRKIILLFIIFLAFLHSSISAANEVSAPAYSISNQEQIISIFDQSSNQTDFIGTDFLELTEDEISHFEKNSLPP